MPGDFHLSSADGLLFTDGTLFSAISPDDSVLTSSLPHSFAYLEAQAASITLNGSVLSFSPAAKVSVSAGHLEFIESDVWFDEGELRLSAMGQTIGVVPLDGELPDQGSGAVTLSSTDLYTSGNGGGLIRFDAGDMIFSYSDLFADNFGNNDGTGGIYVNASQLSLTSSNFFVNAYEEGNAGKIGVNVDGVLQILHDSEISCDTFSSGNAGSVTVTAGELTMDGQGYFAAGGAITSRANGYSSGDAGPVVVTVDDLLQIFSGAHIASDTWSFGNAGRVTVTAGELIMDGQGASAVTGYVTGISSEAGSDIVSETGPGYDYSGDAGHVEVTVDGLLQIRNGARISSDTLSFGNAGKVMVTAGELTMDGMVSSSFTGIASQAALSSHGDAGPVAVTVQGLLQIVNGSSITSDTFSSGNAGDLTVTAGELVMDGLASSSFTGITSSTLEDHGDAGQVMVTVDGLLQILGGAEISSDTFSTGDAGSVTVSAAELNIDGQDSAYFTGITSSTIDGSGDAGQVLVDVEGLLQISDGAQITSDTLSSGNAGSVTVTAGDLCMDNAHSAFTGISSSTLEDQGDAGQVLVTVDQLLEIISGAEISSSTFSAGNAGSVLVSAASIVIDDHNSNLFTGISSEANIDSTGLVGSVTVRAESLDLSQNGFISITGDQVLASELAAAAESGSLVITADRFNLCQNSSLSAATGGNVSASPIFIQAGELLLSDASRITTSANEADGGPIVINCERIIIMDSQISTSVAGKTGDGGNITISGIGKSAPLLIMDSGFIQANTAAEEARGGDISLDVQAAIASYNNLHIGGSVRQTFTADSLFNIIQAAAPGGEQGTITLSAPQLDLSGTLVALQATVAEPVQLATDPCRFTDHEKGSSLLFVNKGE